MSEAPQTLRYSLVVVDDQAALRRLYHLAFKGRPFDIVGEAGDGREGVDIVGRTKPDLVLLDLSMPTMDGLEAILEMKRASPQTRFVILSGFEAWRLGDVAKELGANAYLEKGLPPGTIIDALLKVALEPPAPVTDPSALFRDRLAQLV